VLWASLKEIQQLVDEELKTGQFNSALAHQELLEARLDKFSGLYNPAPDNSGTEQADAGNAEGDSSPA